MYILTVARTVWYYEKLAIIVKSFESWRFDRALGLFNSLQSILWSNSSLSKIFGIIDVIIIIIIIIIIIVHLI